jgi:hypothetical protein
MCDPTFRSVQSSGFPLLCGVCGVRIILAYVPGQDLLDGPSFEQFGAICLANENGQKPKHDSGPDDHHVIRPPPRSMLVDKSRHNRTQYWADERCSREDHHRTTIVSYLHAVGNTELMKEKKTDVPTFTFGKTSDMAPPDTDRNADPANPVKKRKMR